MFKKPIVTFSNTNNLIGLSKKDKKGVFLGIFGLFCFFLPYLVLGQDSVWSTSDYLELVVVWYKVLIEQDALFSSNHTQLFGIVDQLPRGVFASEFFFKTWLFYFFPPFEAILANKLLIHLIAYLSMFHFLANFPRFGESVTTKWLYALIWSTFSFWPESGIATAALPSVYFVFFKLSQGERLRIRYLGLILCYCGYTLLHLQGLFVGVGLFLTGVFKGIRAKKFQRAYWLGFLFFTILLCLANYRHFLIFFLDPGDFIPHRVEYDIYSFGGFHEKFWPAYFNILSFGQLHSIRFSPFLFFSTFLILNYWKFNSKKIHVPCLELAFKFIWIFSGLVALAVLSRYIPIVELVDHPVLHVFSYDRFLVLFYPILFVSFVLAIEYVKDNLEFGRFIYASIVIVILAYSVLVLDDNHKNVFLKPLTGLGERVPTFREFYAENQFRDLKSTINTSEFPGGKVVSIGIHPAVASFNGLHSLDGYTGNYPLAYKHQFSEIILPEIQKEGKEYWLLKLFMGWGNKCYMFNSEHQDLFLRSKWQEPIPLNNPAYNWDALLAMGGRFVLSTDPIENCSRLKLLKISDHIDSAWKIYLYQVI